MVEVMVVVVVAKVLLDKVVTWLELRMAANPEKLCL